MNIPNALSIFRLVLLPVFMIVFYMAPQNGGLWGVLILAVSGMTDFLDGFIARKLGQVTQLGTVLDPVADKLTQLAVSFCIASRYPEYFIIFGFIVLKELAMIFGALKIASLGDGFEPAHWYGKLYTIIFYVLMLILLVFPDLNLTIRSIFFLVMLVAIIFAVGMYFPLFLRIMRARKRQKQEQK